MNLIPGILMTFLFLSGTIFLIVRMGRIYKFISGGTGVLSTEPFNERTLAVLKYIFGQLKLFKDPVPGLLHFFIFYGFLLISVGTVEMLLQTYNPAFTFSFLGPIYDFLIFSQDILSFIVLFAILYGLYRRFIVKTPRLQNVKAATLDATIVLIFILFLMVTLIFMNGLKCSDSESSFLAAPFAFLAGKFISLFNFDLVTKILLIKINHYVHILLIIGFMFYLPFSKHIHLIMVFPNVFFKKLTPAGALSKLNLEDEKAESFGVSKLMDFSKKQLLDSFTCVECGRCQEFCPTTLSKKDLNPKFLITKLKDLSYETMKNPNYIKKLIGETITNQEIWDCTTCLACTEACPLLIEHPDKIVDLRRYLTLTESNFPAEAQNVFKNFENNSNPWGIGSSSRASYVKELGVKTISAGEKAEYLLYLGCAASFDDRNTKVGKALINVLNAGGINFGVLGEEESCCGETARRLGNEYLHSILVSQLVDTFKKYGIKKVITACPHCFNTLKNEYPQYDLMLEVYHHSQFLYKLLSEKKLNPDPSKLLKKQFVYHDSCYLGRYNEIYQEPREILSNFLKANLAEAERKKGKALCCGAGGGRMWLEEKNGTRINTMRTEELIKDGCNSIITACPYCLTMINDGITEIGKAETHTAKDFVEILAEVL